jgi:hypothetical protein
MLQNEPVVDRLAIGADAASDCNKDKREHERNNVIKTEYQCRWWRASHNLKFSNRECSERMYDDAKVVQKKRTYV